MRVAFAPGVVVQCTIIRVRATPRGHESEWGHEFERDTKLFVKPCCIKTNKGKIA